MSNLFNSIQITPPSSNVFDLSHDVKLSMNMGQLIPTLCMEVVPGDKFNMSSEMLLRMAPMISPVMHRVDAYLHYFFVPNRLVWNGWEQFITGGEDPIVTPAAPYFENFTVLEGSLADYLGLPLGLIGVGTKISALPFAAYQKIYNEYYRDQNLIDENPDTLLDGSNTASLFNNVRNRAWEHDYFTSALPFAQKGPAVTVPSITTDVPVYYDNPSHLIGRFDAWNGGASVPAGTNAIRAVYSGTGTSGPTQIASGAGIAGAYDPSGTLFADTSTAGGITVRALRLSFALQKWYEKNARAGSRYVESILSNFGVRSSDARLMRPEYIGGSKQNVVISEVLQNSQSDETPQGNMAGHGLSIGAGRAGNYYAEEHGYIIGIMSVMPKTSYSQGIPRHFIKQDRTLFYWPDFANVGEQEILNGEIYYNAADTTINQGTFGYTPRYAEYKYHDNRIAGEMRTTLSNWHMSRIFSSRPSLNANFVTADPTQRIFAVTDPAPDKLYVHLFHRIRAIRKMPKYGTPSI